MQSDIVLRYYELIDTDELDAMYRLFHEDIVYRRPGYATITGMEALREFYESDRVIASGEHTIVSLVAHDDKVAAEGEFRGTLGDGAEVSVRFADFFSFDAGKIVWRNTYFDAPLV